MTVAKPPRVRNTSAPRPLRTRVFRSCCRPPFLVLLAVLVGGCITGHLVATTEAASPRFPVLPYLDIASMDTPPAHAAADAGMSGCILGFVVATAVDDATPCWGLAGPADGTVLSKEIAELRARGLDLWVSFGGADHRDLACVARTPEALMALYEDVVCAYGFTGADFDVEGDALKDKESVLRRAQAWRLWRDRGSMPPSILTVPVLPSGLTQDVLDMLLVHRRLGVLPDRLNLMVMNYGASNAPAPTGRMFELAVSAASNTVAQLRDHSLSALVGGSTGFARVGLTPMIGRNAVPEEQFHLRDARSLREWSETAQPGLLSFWSLNRDRNCATNQGVSHCSSGVSQAELEFLRTLAALPAASNPPPTAVVSPVSR